MDSGGRVPGSFPFPFLADDGGERVNLGWGRGWRGDLHGANRALAEIGGADLLQGEPAWIDELTNGVGQATKETLAPVTVGDVAGQHLSLERVLRLLVFELADGDIEVTHDRMHALLPCVLLDARLFRSATIMPAEVAPGHCQFVRVLPATL